ncbi:MAG: HAD hydrolase-like protein [Streptosporangiales bacterium]|nr:HAD hydrolase-like protein [Streptosporangiales bacterium]
MLSRRRANSGTGPQSVTTRLGNLTRVLIGFDLDMTLADSRSGIVTTMDALSAETGVPIDSALVVSRLGPPLEQEIAEWFPAAEVAPMTARYRELYAELGVTGAVPMPGAAASVRTVRERGGRVAVVTAKHAGHAAAMLDHLDLRPDVLVGWRFGHAKGETLRELGASVYIGDHLGDVDAARTAGAYSIGVATGPYSGAELLAYGADAALESLADFPAWLGGYVTGMR